MSRSPYAISALFCAFAFFLALLGARYISTTGWIVSLWLAAAFAAATVALLVGWVVTRRWPTQGKPIVALALGAAATASRYTLVETQLRGPNPNRVEILPLAVAMATIAWGALALLWGTSSLADYFESSQAKRTALSAIAALVAVILGLYCLGPLWFLLGIRANVWTLIALAALVTGAFAIDRIHRRIRG